MLLAFLGGFIIGAIAVAGDWSTADIYGSTLVFLIVFVPTVLLLQERWTSRHR